MLSLRLWRGRRLARRWRIWVTGRARGMRSAFEEAAKQAENEARRYPVTPPPTGTATPPREITVVDQPLNIDLLFRDL